MPVEPVVASEGWGVLHLYYHLRRDVLADPQFPAAEAGRDFLQRLRAFISADDYQVIACSVLSQKADIGLMLLGPDLARLDTASIELSSSLLGQALVPAGSYLSLTELSEYSATPEEESARLVAEEGLEEGTDEHDEALAAFRERSASYAEHRLHPRLPKRRVLGFYPMSKRRDGADNWYSLDFDARRELMAGHARVGQRYRGRITPPTIAAVGPIGKLAPYEAIRDALPGQETSLRRRAV